jgi:hypothetical protein
MTTRKTQPEHFNTVANELTAKVDGILDDDAIYNKLTERDIRWLERRITAIHNSAYRTIKVAMRLGESNARKGKR